jgi:hypothetical protein
VVTGTLQLAGLLGLGKLGYDGVLQVIKKLRGRKLEHFELLPDGKASVTIDGEQLIVEREVVDLVRDYRIRLQFEKLIAQPLESEGIDTFAMADPKTKKVHVLVEKREARYFVAPPPDEADEDVVEFETRLQIVSLSFQDGNKWRFSDGDQSFYAAIIDEEFNDRVERREEHFVKGDRIRARVRRRQYIVDGKLRAEYQVVKVLGHMTIPPVSQPGLGLKNPDRETDLDA